MKPLKSIIDVILACEPEHIKNKYRELRFMYWDEEINDSRCLARRYQEHVEPVPWEIVFHGHLYRQGQCSGLSMGLVWFDRIS